MMQENSVPEFAIITSREFWEQKTYEEIKKRTYLDPLYDAAFKAFLNDEQALVSFLNGVFRFEGENRITSVTIKNTEINIIFPQVKTCKLDIRATTSNGFCINVEMQKAKHFSRNQQRNSPMKNVLGREASRYEIPPTFAIWVCDFPLEKQDEYRGTWAIRNEKGLTITEKVKYILYDLTRFNKMLDEIRTDEDRWLYLLKNAGSSNDLPDFDDDVIAQAIKRLLVKTASETLLKEQAKNMVMTEEELDYLASLKVRARDEGRADAISVFRDLGVSPEKIAEAKARLDALSASQEK